MHHLPTLQFPIRHNPSSSNVLGVPAHPALELQTFFHDPTFLRSRKAVQPHGWGVHVDDVSWTRAESASPDATDDVILSIPVPHRSGPDDSDELLPLQEVERRHIQQVLAATGGQLNRAAQILGIHRNTLRRKLQDTK